MTNSLTIYTAIPTAARGKVRAFVKSQPKWMAWIASMGVESREAKNKDLLDFAIQHNLQPQVLAIINNRPLPEATVVGAGVADAFKGSYSGPCDSLDELHAMQEMKAKEDAEMAVAMVAVMGEEKAPAKVDDLLAGVDQFLSPYVRAEIEKALAPVIEAANKPAVEKVVEKIVHVQAPAEAPAGELAYAVKGEAIELGKVFGFRGGHAKKVVHLWESHGAAPAIDPLYVVDPFNMAMMATALDRGENVWLVGPGGSGKTSMPEQFCAYTGRPFVKLSFTRNSHVDDMVGGQGVKNGNSGWEDGVLLQAMQRPGTVILLDELTFAPAGVQALFQGCADDHRTYFRPNGQKVVAAQGVVFVVADNTNGAGDETGIYSGTNQSNGALVNRFKRMLRIDYMSKEQETRALHNHTGAPLAACAHMAEFVARARKLPAMENVVLSLRNMTAFVRCVQDGFTPKEAAQVTMLNMLPSTERAALDSLFTLTWAGEFAALVSGSQVDVAPRPQGSANADGGAFDDEVTASLNR